MVVKDCQISYHHSKVLVVNYTGAGENLEQATQPVYLNVKGRKIAVLNFMDNTTFTEFSASEMSAATNNSSGYSPADWNIIKNRIDEAKNNSDATVVVFHYGNEYSYITQYIPNRIIA